MPSPPAPPTAQAIWRYCLYLRHNPRLLIVPAVVLAAVVTLFAKVTTAKHEPVENRLPLASVATVRSNPPSTAGRSLVVYVVGAVHKPGVYSLAEGARVLDAVAAAGGLVADADAARVNLAARVADGTRLAVPRVGEVATVDAGGASAGSGEANGPLNLNSATAEQLDKLPGVGLSTAAAIVAFREQHGAFRSIDQLLDIRGIGPARLEELRPHVTV